MKSPLVLVAFFALVSFVQAETDSSFTRENALECLSADLSTHYAVSEMLDVDFIRPWSAPRVENAGQAIDVRIIDYPEVLAPSMLLHVRYLQGESILREDTVAVRVALWRDALVSAMPLSKNDSVARESVEIRRVDGLRDRESLPVSAISDEYVFTRSIPAGRPLTWRDVTRRSLVHRGQLVEVHATDGMLNITMKAMAMQDGARGEPVRVRNLDSKREFVALVTAENRAQVRF